MKKTCVGLIVMAVLSPISWWMFTAAVALAGPAIVVDTGGASDRMLIKYAKIDAATSGDNTIVAAVTGKRIRVLSVWILCASAVNVRFESAAGGTALSGQANVAANGGFVLPYNEGGWFQTVSAELLNLELSGAVSCDGSLSYVEAPTTGD